MVGVLMIKKCSFGMIKDGRSPLTAVEKGSSRWWFADMSGVQHIPMSTRRTRPSNQRVTGHSSWGREF